MNIERGNKLFFSGTAFVHSLDLKHQEHRMFMAVSHDLDSLVEEAGDHIPYNESGIRTLAHTITEGGIDLGYALSEGLSESPSETKLDGFAGEVIDAGPGKDEGMCEFLCYDNAIKYLSDFLDHKEWIEIIQWGAHAPRNQKSVFIETALEKLIRENNNENYRRAMVVAERVAGGEVFYPEIKEMLHIAFRSPSRKELIEAYQEKFRALFEDSREGYMRAGEIGRKIEEIR